MATYQIVQMMVIGRSIEGICNWPVRAHYVRETITPELLYDAVMVWAARHADILVDYPIVIVSSEDPLAEWLFTDQYWGEVPIIDVEEMLDRKPIAVDQPTAGQVAVAVVVSDPLKEEPKNMIASSSQAEPLATKKLEQVLVFPTENWRSFFMWGVVPVPPLVAVESDTLIADFANSLVEDRELPQEFQWRFEDRTDLLENDTTLLQPIPYITFLSGSKGLEEIFVYQRAKGQGESRLLKKWSVGVGGHCNPCVAGPNPYRSAVVREIEEELGPVGLDVLLKVHHGQIPSPVAFLYDVSVPVNAVHLGGLHLIRTSGRPEFACEASMANPDWEPLMKAHSRIEDFEPWSQLVINWLVSMR